MPERSASPRRASPPAPLPLRKLQEWMQATIVHPDGAARGLRSRAAASIVAPRAAQQRIRLRGGLSATDRLDIYASMYPIRMHDALATDYPGLRLALGEHRFRRMVDDYIRVHPSRSWTLNRLGDHLPDWLARQRELRPRALVDLARYELALTAAFDAPAAPSVDAGRLSALAQSDGAVDRSRITLAPSARLLRFDFPVDLWLEALREGKTRAPRRQTTFLLVSRAGIELRVRRLSPIEFELMGILATGTSLGRAISAVDPTGRLHEATLFGWFADWMRLGAIGAVGTAARRQSGGPAR